MNTNEDTQMDTLTEDTLAVQGSAVKALGNGKIGGYLVLFSTAKDPDLANDYFTPNTDFDLARSAKSSVYYAHGLDKRLGKTKLAEGELKADEVGVWIDTQLDLRDAYQAGLYAMAKAGKLGWSSGTAPHLVERKAVKGAQEIIRWPLGLDASLTPTPCEPRTAACAVKTLTFEALEDSMKMMQSEVREVLRQALREAEESTELMDVDEDAQTLYYQNWEDGKTYGCSYKWKTKDGVKYPVLDEEYEVRQSTQYTALNQPKAEKAVTTPTISIEQENLPVEDLRVQLPTSSLKDHWDVCLLNIRVLKNRLNSLKEIRMAQGRKSPLSAENLALCRELEGELKSLAEQTEYAMSLQNENRAKQLEKVNTIQQVFDQASEVMDFLDSL